MQEDPELGGQAPSASYMARTAAHNTGYATADGNSGEENEAAAAKKKRGNKGIFQTLQTLHIILHMLWIKLHHFLFGELMIRFVYGKPSLMNRRIVVLGDDYALGVGDWVTAGRYPGIQRHINDNIEQYVSQKSQRVIRQGVTWTATCTAVSGSTALDWMPRSKRDCTTGILFEGIFDRNVGTDPDADIVCVLLGAHMHKHAVGDDADKVFLEYQHHLESICSELMRRGKYVLLSTVPLSLIAAEDEILLNNNRIKNDIVRQVVTKLRRNVPDGCDAAQLTLIDSCDALKQSVHFRFGGRLLSGAGYMAISRAFMTAIVNCVDQVETKSIFVKKMV